MKRVDPANIVAVIARNVRSLRLAAGLSQEELGYEANLDRTYISQVERSKRNLTVIALARIAKALRVPVDQLVRPS
jgi:transcriptional regulator with XRE-family HTH domain